MRKDGAEKKATWFPREREPAARSFRKSRFSFREVHPVRPAHSGIAKNQPKRSRSHLEGVPEVGCLEKRRLRLGRGGSHGGCLRRKRPTPVAHPPFPNRTTSGTPSKENRRSGSCSLFWGEQPEPPAVCNGSAVPDFFWSNRAQHPAPLFLLESNDPGVCSEREGSFHEVAVF